MLASFQEVSAALSREPVRTPQSEMGWRTASLAIVITPTRELLFMKRAEVASDPWSGQISFPGGKSEPDDVDSAATAIREAHEEIGVDLSEAIVLGEMDEIATLRGLPSLVIRPHVFGLLSQPAITMNLEVASVHRIGLQALLTGVGRSEFDFHWQDNTIKLPCVSLDGHRLWGLTLMVVDDLLNRIDGKGKGLERPQIVQ